jgi:hypothetical protein
MIQTPDFKYIVARRAQRLKVCADCPEKKQAYGFEVCGLCNCVLAGKASLPPNGCPLKKWKE